MWKTAAATARKYAFVLVEPVTIESAPFRASEKLRAPAALHLQWKSKEQAVPMGVIAAYVGAVFCVQQIAQEEKKEDKN